MCDVLKPRTPGTYPYLGDREDLLTACVRVFPWRYSGENAVLKSDVLKPLTPTYPYLGVREDLLAFERFLGDTGVRRTPCIFFF